MKKTFYAIIILIGIACLTPIIPITINYLIDDIQITGITGNVLLGFKFDTLSYKNFHGKNIEISNNLDLYAKTANLYGLPISNTHLKYKNKQLHLITNLYNSKLSGVISNKQMLKFDGIIQHPPLQPQKITFIKDNKYLKLQSKGSLGYINFEKKIASNIINLKIERFDANLLLDKKSEIKLLFANGSMKLGNHKSGYIDIHDQYNNHAYIAIKPKITIEFNFPNAGIWLKKKIKSTKGYINLSSLGDVTSAQINTTITPKKKIILNMQGKQATAEILVDNNIFLLKANYKPRIPNPNLQQLKTLCHHVIDRFLNHTYAHPTQNIPFSEIELNLYVNSSTPKLALTSTIKFNPLMPEQTIISASSEKFGYKYHGHNIKDAILQLDSNSNKTYLAVNGLYNNKNFKALLDIGKKWNLRLDADNLYSPISANTTLIISPHLQIEQKLGIFHITGTANIAGGFIQSNANDSIVDMPENVIIIGSKSKHSIFDMISKNIEGSIQLKTTAPIKVENLAGLNGNLVGELFLKLETNKKPKFNGTINLLQPSYKKNKNISVLYAKATYENNAIDNPFLHIKLSRAISQPSFDFNNLTTIHKKQKVGIKIHGSAAEPNFITYSSNPELSKLQIISALETGSVNGINAEQGIISLFSLFDSNSKNSASPLESIQNALNLDEIYISGNLSASTSSNNLINPNLGESSLVLTKTLMENIKASYIASLHNSDYLVNVSYPLTDNINVNLYSSHTSQPNLSRNIENYGLNILMYHAE